jgi:hypothetical protein
MSNLFFWGRPIRYHSIYFRNSLGVGYPGTELLGMA